MSWILVVLLLLAAGSTVSATFAYLSTYRRLKRLEAELPEGRGHGTETTIGVPDPAGLLAQAPIGVYAADQTGRVLYVNKRLARWLAAEPEALSGVARLADCVREASAAGERASSAAV